MIKYISVLATCLVLLSSCNNRLKYFTQDLYEDFKWSPDELAAIQFYVSDDIVLWKKLSAEEARISRGKIRVIDGSKMEEVIIQAGTPGVYLQSPKENRFAISFEDDESKFLMFGPNSKNNGRYVLLGKEWTKNRGFVTYGGETYETSSSSSYASLMVDIKKAQSRIYKTRKAGGKKVR